jgi:hypothetical protein
VTEGSGGAAWREPGQIITADYRQNGTLRYTAEGRDIVGRNLDCFNNRPLYCEARTDGVVLAGDRPFLRLLVDPYVHGGLALGIVRDEGGIWLHDATEVESRYHCGRMTWRVADVALPGVTLVVDAVPLKDDAGFAVRVKATGMRNGDRLVWTFGGAREQRNVRVAWDPIFRGNPDICKTGDPRKPELSIGILPEWSRGNQVVIEDRVFRLRAHAEAAQRVVGSTNRNGALLVCDASACESPARLCATPASELPIACGTIPLCESEDELFLATMALSAEPVSVPLPIADPAAAFHAATSALDASEQVRVETPDPLLDAAVAAVCHAVDRGCDQSPCLFRPISGDPSWVGEPNLAIFRHGCMSFSVHFLGWRVICGSTALGWHDRVRGNAAFYVANQVLADAERLQPQSDPDVRLCHEGRQSRLFGRGHIGNSPGMYNTQSQFFDQTIHAWRWTADEELEKLLRPALELHLEWARECFDPDDDGLYESYINTLPTDSVWYNGGGSVEESAYAFTGHTAARDMARRAGNDASAAFHQERADKIKKALNRVLWLDTFGHYGAYVEQGGHGRVHGDSWVYSQSLPIDAGMTIPEQALRALYYTEWALERIPLPFGGELCQPSNWVPSRWSVRDMFGGDMWHLALMYFKTGLAAEGWKLLRGAMLESAYAGAVPGGFSHIGAGTDFGDCRDLFARAVVEGLFGFAPDYPGGTVRIWPMLPPEWPTASITTPDFTFAFERAEDVDSYRLTLQQKGRADFRLPVNAERVRGVRLNGRQIEWSAEPGFGCTWVRALVEDADEIELAIEVTGRVTGSPSTSLSGQVGHDTVLTTPVGTVSRWNDFHGAVENARSEGSSISGRFAQKPGSHLLRAEVEVGDLPQWHLFKLQITDPVAEARRNEETGIAPPGKSRWRCLDVTRHYNGDIRTIFKQEYLSPRPATCSVRLGVDGYSAWTFPYWRNDPPTIDLLNLDALSESRGRILTPQRIPFTRFADDNNVAFTSLWDNWPSSVTIPVNLAGEAVGLLVCGSTFPMQLRIANAELRFRYADGGVETRELIPPMNFWSLCSWGGYDYNYETDAFALPETPPPTVQLGNNCRVMVLSWRLRPGVELESVTLETLSQDVVTGLMGISVQNPSG